MVFNQSFELRTPGRGTFEITDRVQHLVGESGVAVIYQGADGWLFDLNMPVE